MPHIILLTDPDDPRGEPYREIRERDLVGRQGRFVAEGEVVLRLLLRQRRFAVDSLLVDERRIAAIADLLDLVPDETPVYAARQKVLDGITGFHLHRGLLGIGCRADLVAGTLLAALPERALVLGAVGIANHDNVGGLFRNAAAFGAGAVLLDQTSCDPLYRKAIRVSVGAALTVPFAREGSAADMLEALEAANFSVLALSPAGAMSLDEVQPAARTALLVGAEGPGLPAEVLARCRTVSIPMAAGFDSLNVATAAAIALYRLSR